MGGRGGRQNWYATGTRFCGEVFGPLFVGASREVGPIHHRGEGEAAGEAMIGDIGGSGLGGAGRFGSLSGLGLRGSGES